MENRQLSMCLTIKIEFGSAQRMAGIGNHGNTWDHLASGEYSWRMEGA